VILIDANVLLYAYNASDPRHPKARAWLEGAVAGPTPIRLAWVTVLAFVRIGTNPRAFAQPMSLAEATATVSRWLEQPSVGLIEPTPRHWEILEPLLGAAQARGDLVTDAHLAALAIEHGASVCTTDRDFARFPGLRTIDPLST
jgi:toxin-antitoxin system PIN domain toxin